MANKIAVFDHRMPPEARQQIQSLSASPVEFSTQRIHSLPELIAGTGDADIVLSSPWQKITKEYLDACPNIKYIGLCGTSTANIDLEELKKRGIAFTNIVHGDKEPVAEFFFMQLVMLARGVGEYQWKPDRHELKGVTIGIIGLGSVGQAIAQLALAYKMNVSYFSPHRKMDWEKRGLVYQEMPELSKSNEIIVICSPTNVEVLGKQEFDLMKPGRILVQASAGNDFNKTAFLDWISKDGNFAIFDLSANDDNFRAYKDIPRVIFSEIVAGDTYESNLRRGLKAIENLKTYLHSKDE